MRLEDYWYTRNAVASLLLPLAWLFRLISALRRQYYRKRNANRLPLPVPVIVVGNITVGGTGKTPLVIWLVEFLRSQGFKPGVISRGYGGQAKNWPLFVTPDSDPAKVGDEPVLIASHCACPMAVGPDRTEVARTLLQAHECNVLISDDGLQHYALLRDLEIAVIDGERRLGNGYCLPAGPLRESPHRLREVDFVVITDGVVTGKEFLMKLEGTTAINMVAPEVSKSISDFKDVQIDAMAGIGNPERFFKMLNSYELDIIKHPFPDHYDFTPKDLAFADNRPVFMTEKDAVKIKGIAKRNFWYIPVTAKLDSEFGEKILDSLKETFRGQKAT